MDQKKPFYKTKEGMYLIGGVIAGMFILYFIVPLLIAAALAGLVYLMVKKKQQDKVKAQ